MRTTVILPDELYRQVKERAFAESRTVTSMMEEALRRLLAEQEQRPRKADVILADGYGSEQAAVDLYDKDAVARILDEDDFAVRMIREQQAAQK